jgi:hypothetical protein
MKRLLVITAAVTLFTAGTAFAQPTRGEYIAQAEPICLDTIQSSDAALKGTLPALKHGDFKKGARKFRRAMAIYSGGIDRLAALEMPPADTSVLGNWIQALRAEVTKGNTFASAIARRNPKQVRRSSRQFISAASYAEGLASDYGFQVCSQL